MKNTHGGVVVELKDAVQHENN